MVIKRLRIPLLLMAVVLLLSSTMPLMASAAATDPPEGFTGVTSVDLEVNSGYVWHTPSETEATQFGLTVYLEEAPIYLAGNSVYSKADAKDSVSNLAITVSKPGVLSFEYAMQSAVEEDNLLSTVSSYHYLAYCVNAAISAGARASEVNVIGQANVNPSTDGWVEASINVDESYFTDSETATVYIAFHNYMEETTNWAAIRKVSFGSGDRTDVVQGYDTAMGSVSVAGTSLDKLKVGSTYNLTATASSDYRFYGWVKHYADGSEEFMATEDGVLTITVDTTSYYTPVFAAEDAYILRKGTTFYDSTYSMKTVIESAQSGEELILLQKDAILTENVTIPEGVLLYVPYRDAWEIEEVGYEDSAGESIRFCLRDETNKACHTAIAGESETFARLTVQEGCTLTVEGELVIGSVIGYATQRCQGHVSGAHGRITNNGTILVSDGGTMTCYGIVDGDNEDAVVRVKDGGTLKESFIISDFAGGSNAAEFYFSGQMPFKRFAIQSVQCKLEMECNATLIGISNIWASSQYNKAEITLFGITEAAAFRPTETAASGTLSLTRTYNPDFSLTDQTGLMDASGIGRTEWTFQNGLTFQPLTVGLGAFELDTSASDFAIPYNFKINLKNGTYNIPNGMRIMPGAEMNIEKGASVNVSGRLLVLDGLVQTDILNGNGCLYPTRDMLTNAGFSGSGELTLNGTLNMLEGSTLGGLVKSDGTGKLVIAEGAYVSNSGSLDKVDQALLLQKQDATLYESEGGVAVLNFDGSIARIDNWIVQDGARGAYDDNTTWFNLPARLYTASGIINVATGKTYVASALSEAQTAQYSVSYLYVEDNMYGYLYTTESGTRVHGYLTDDGNRVMASATENLSRTMNAVWAEQGTTVPVTSVTVAGSGTSGTLTYNVTVVYDTDKSGNDTVISNLQAVDATDTTVIKTEKYVYLVKYTTEGGAAVTVSPTTDGEYIIPGDAAGITIEACLLGDANGNGKINSNDLITISKYIAGLSEPSELAKLAWDANQNGKYNSNDLITLSKYIAGLIELG